MYFAELDKNNIVIRVIVAESIQWCVDHLGGTWVETTKDGTKNYAGSGHAYHSDKGNFSEPQPYDSWALDTACKWQAPVAMPADGKPYMWNETTKNWDDVSSIISITP